MLFWLNIKKLEFIEYLDNYLKESNTFNIWKCQLIGNFHVSLLNKKNIVKKNFLTHKVGLHC